MLTVWLLVRDWCACDAGLPAVWISQPSGCKPRPVARWLDVNGVYSLSRSRLHREARTRLVLKGEWPYVIMIRFNWLSRWLDICGLDRLDIIWGYKSIPHRCTSVYWQQVGSHWLSCMSLYTCCGQLKPSLHRRLVSTDFLISVICHSSQRILSVF